MCIYQINENNVETCPQILVYLGNRLHRALSDTGCQCSIISEDLYKELKAEGANWLELPTQNIVLKSAFTGKTQRVNRQALVPLSISDIPVEQIMLISPKLVTQLIVGMDFCIENNIVIDFTKARIIMKTHDGGTAQRIKLVNERYKNSERRRAEVDDSHTADLRNHFQASSDEYLSRQEDPSLPGDRKQIEEARKPGKERLRRNPQKMKGIN
jgi:hypothetical protein